jgi:flagellar biosynthesis protein FlhF
MSTPQRFRGKTAEEARSSASLALGGEPVIVATRKVKKPGIVGLFGVSEFEVSAQPKAAAVPDVRARPFGARLYETASQGGNGSQDFPSEIRSDLRMLRSAVARTESTLPRIVAELSRLRDVLPEDKGTKAPVRGKAAVLAFLAERGLGGALQAQVARSMSVTCKKEQESRALGERYCEAISPLVRVSSFPLPAARPTVIVLLGRTGVGKTTTAAKLAARAVFDHDQTVTLVSADAQRVGAVEQLAKFAKLMGVQFATARDATELSSVVGRATTDVVIVDTSGTAGAGGLPNLTELGSPREIVPLLCIPAGVAAADVAALGRVFSGCALAGLIVTKLDETLVPSVLLHAPFGLDLPIVALTSGPRVPEDIAPATKSAVLAALGAAIPSTVNGSVS